MDSKLTFRILRCLLLIMTSTPLITRAQVSFGGTPPSLSNQRSQAFHSAFPVRAVNPTQDIQMMKQQDAMAERHGMLPVLGLMLPTRIDLAKDGEWTIIGGDSVCRISVVSRQAPGINLYYEKFQIPHGGKLFIHAPKVSQVLGAYTEETNRAGGSFATEIVYSDSLILEYVHPARQAKPEIIVSEVGYCYNLKATISPGESRLRATSPDDCFVDVNCNPEGDLWTNQKKGVARLIVPIGEILYWCSGSLINNVNQDKTPYFLSAHHCFEQNSQKADFSRVQFYFHYETTQCGGSTVSPNARTMVGADLLVDIPMKGGSDGALLRLKTPIPDHYDVYYNGWDTTSDPPPAGVVIHHPSGEPKKISTYSEAPITITFTDLGVPSVVDGHWQLVYSATANGHSVSAGGSSGSPLFNHNGKIVGTLTGGISFCYKPTDPDYFGKFYYHWDKDPDPDRRLSKYLNPLNYPIVGINGTSVIADTIKEERIADITPRIVDEYLSVITTYAIKELSVYSISGKRMVRTTNHLVDTRAWPPGIYIVTAVTSAGSAKAKVIKK